MSWADDMWDSAINEAKRMVETEQAIKKMKNLDAAVGDKMNDKQLFIAHFTKQYPYMAALRLDELLAENDSLKKQLTEKA